MFTLIEALTVRRTVMSLKHCRDRLPRSPAERRPETQHGALGDFFQTRCFEVDAYSLRD